jgi:hypothetical protein
MSSNAELTILFQYGGRPYLEKIARNFLMESLKSSGDINLDIDSIELNCVNKTIGQGFNELIDKVRTDFVIWTPDDFGFFPNGNWIALAIKILKENPDIGIIDLRKERDNAISWKIHKKRKFNLTPFTI